jgi:hypothetical protein
MNIREKLACIKFINPGAECVVWEDGTVKYEEIHTGPKPTDEECEAVLSEIQSVFILERQRVEEIKSGKETSGLKKITVQQAHDIIDNRINGATTAEEIKAEVAWLLKKMIVYILE